MSISDVTRSPIRNAGWLLLILLLLTLVACRNGDTPALPEGEPAAQARLSVSGSGLFTVSASTLASMGWRVDDPLTLTLNGKEMAIQRGENELYFYISATEAPTRYSKEKALWLTYGEAASTDSSPGYEEELTQLTAVRRLTGETEYKSIFETDPWFWTRILSSQSLEERIATPDRQAGEVTLAIQVAGLTNIDHRVLVKLDGEQVGIFDWTGQERYEATIASEQPAGESLVLSIEVPEDNGPADQTLIDEVVVSYPTAPVAVDGLFEGRSAENGVVRIEGLREPLGWQLGERQATLPIEEGALSVPADTPIVALSRDRAQSVTALSAAAEAIPTAGADYVAVVAPTLRSEVEPLLAFHESEGRSTMLVEPQQIYDRYSEGLVDPLAIREMLKDAQLNWETVPQWILLVGDSTYDPQGYRSEVPEAYIPSPFVMTIFGGETVSDNIIADLDEDGYPDVALGRLPARSPEQLRNYIEKRLAYSTETDAGEWTNRVVLAADGTEEIFRNTSESMRDILPSFITSATLYPEVDSDAEAMVLPELERGSLIVNYIGHGSVEQWGKDQLLTSQNAAGLSNGEKLPFYINMTCLAGLFSHPEQESLGESLLWAEQGGAIATVAPTSLTLPTGQTKLNSELMTGLLGSEGVTVGEALDRAKRMVEFLTENDRDVVATFNLLGDPALELLRPTLETSSESAAR